MPNRSPSRADDWPSLPSAVWDETRATLHMWTQIIGKIRLAQAPMTNHWWQVPLYVTSRGLTTSPIPYGARTFQIDLDFIKHGLQISIDDGKREGFALGPRSVADFHSELMGRMRSLGLEVPIWTMPCEIEHPIRFEDDHQHAAYDADFANCFWRVLVQADRVLTAFRARFLGKVSPVHFFWGSFDLAVTRFSGRAGAAASGRPQRCGQGDARGLFARSQQRRLLARRRGPVRACLLRLRLSRAGRVCAGRGGTRRGFLQQRLRRVSAALRGRPAGGGTGRSPPRIPAEHLRSSSGSRPMGPRHPGAYVMEGWTETWRGIVAPWECDITEHFTIAYYFDRLADATAIMAGSAGLGREHRASAGRRFDVRFVRELRAGASFHILSAPLALDAASFRLGHQFVDSANGEVTAWVEETFDIAAAALPREARDTIGRRLSPWPGPAVERRPEPSTFKGFIPTARDRVKPIDLDPDGNFALAALSIALRPAACRR